MRKQVEKKGGKRGDNLSSRAGQRGCSGSKTKMLRLEDFVKDCVKYPD